MRITYLKTLGMMKMTTVCEKPNLLWNLWWPFLESPDNLPTTTRSTNQLDTAPVIRPVKNIDLFNKKHEPRKKANNTAEKISNNMTNRKLFQIDAFVIVFVRHDWQYWRVYLIDYSTTRCYVTGSRCGFFNVARKTRHQK